MMRMILYLDDPVYGSKKKYIKEIFILEKCLIDSLKETFEENTFWDFSFQATWFNQDLDQTITSASGNPEARSFILASFYSLPLHLHL